MKPWLVILRPQPGADATAERAHAAGFETVIAPLFEILPVEWAAPEPDAYAALVLTSANALRHGGQALLRYRNLPVHAVGETTAAMARAAGFTVVETGRGGIAGLLPSLRKVEGRLLRLTGRAHVEVDDPTILMDDVAIYEARSLALSAEAVSALSHGAIALLHSGEAARHFGHECEGCGLSRADIGLAVFSEKIAAAAGTGWRAVAVADSPDDDALLSAAQSLANRPK